MGSKIRQSGDLRFAGGMGRPDYCGVKLRWRTGVPFYMCVITDELPDKTH